MIPIYVANQERPQPLAKLRGVVQLGPPCARAEKARAAGLCSKLDSTGFDLAQRWKRLLDADNPSHHCSIFRRASSLVAAVGTALISFVGEFEPSFGDFKQFGLFFFFASSLLRGSQSFLSVAAILFSFADHAIAAETFRKSKFRGEGMLSLVIWKT